MFSTDDGATWRALRLNLPTVAVHDLVVKGDDLVVGTHGRSIWILDDLQPVREFNDRIADADVHLFPVADATRWRLGGGSWADQHARFSNPPTGASIYYFLKQKPKGELKIEILDAANRTVRTLSSVPREPDFSSENDDPEAFKKAALPTEPGVHRAEWDLTWEGARKIKGAKIDTGDPSRGPTAVPGAYTVRLTVDGKTLASPLLVRPDPAGSAPQADLDAQLAFALRVRDAISSLTGTVNRLRSVRDQLQARTRALESRRSEAAVDDLIQRSAAAIDGTNALEDKLHNPTAEIVYDILAMRGGTRLYSRLAPLQMWAIEGEGRPTAGMQQVLNDQDADLRRLAEETDRFLAEQVEPLNAAAARLGVPFVIVK
jgi:hypothetical protein